LFTTTYIEKITAPGFQIKFIGESYKIKKFKNFQKILQDKSYKKEKKSPVQCF